ncbi:hypothetical protein M3J09_009293 [Ascochyta lentis]
MHLPFGLCVRDTHRSASSTRNRMPRSEVPSRYLLAQPRPCGPFFLLNKISCPNSIHSCPLGTVYYMRCNPSFDNLLVWTLTCLLAFQIRLDALHARPGAAQLYMATTSSIQLFLHPLFFPSLPVLIPSCISQRLVGTYSAYRMVYTDMPSITPGSAFIVKSCVLSCV